MSKVDLPVYSLIKNSCLFPFSKGKCEGVLGNLVLLPCIHLSSKKLVEVNMLPLKNSYMALQINLCVDRVMLIFLLINWLLLVIIAPSNKMLI